ncbi:MAG: hypothetical protein QXI49_05450 [Candidatus Methanomethylicaceae archaeon]
MFDGKIWCNYFQTRINYDNCINCARCLPKEVLKKMFNEMEKSEYKENCYGVTELITCLRLSYFRRILADFPSLPEVYQLIRGHMFHKFFGSEFEVKEIKLEKDFNDFKIIGIADAGNGSLYEFKSVNKLPTLPYPQHVIQLQSYDSLSGLKYEKLILVYFSMNNFTVFDVPKKDVTEFLENRARKLHECLKNNKMPEKEDIGLCNFCRFRIECMLSKG